jgi:lysophospholipase L1-like esterase
MIVCIGDSITAGQRLTDGQPFPVLLEAVAKGVPGDTTRLGLERFPRDVQALWPEVVVIQFGHNDANRWQTDRGLMRVSYAAFVANLTEMVRRIRTFDAQPILCSITQSYLSQQHAEDCAYYDVGLREVAAKQAVHLADVRAVITPEHLIDGLHLNADGHRLYAQVVAAVLP